MPEKMKRRFTTARSGVMKGARETDSEPDTDPDSRFFAPD